jgi:hypothetical protein
MAEHHQYDGDTPNTVEGWNMNGTLLGFGHEIGGCEELRIGGLRI